MAGFAEHIGNSVNHIKGDRTKFDLYQDHVQSALRSTNKSNLKGKNDQEKLQTLFESAKLYIDLVKETKDLLQQKSDGQQLLTGQDPVDVLQSLRGKTPWKKMLKNCGISPRSGSDDGAMELYNAKRAMTLLAAIGSAASYQVRAYARQKDKVLADLSKQQQSSSKSLTTSKRTSYSAEKREEINNISASILKDEKELHKKIEALGLKFSEVLNKEDSKSVFTYTKADHAHFQNLQSARSSRKSRSSAINVEAKHRSGIARAFLSLTSRLKGKTHVDRKVLTQDEYDQDKVKTLRDLHAQHLNQTQGTASSASDQTFFSADDISEIYSDVNETAQFQDSEEHSNRQISPREAQSGPNLAGGSLENPSNMPFESQHHVSGDDNRSPLQLKDRGSAEYKPKPDPAHQVKSRVNSLHLPHLSHLQTQSSTTIGPDIKKAEEQGKANASSDGALKQSSTEKIYEVKPISDDYDFWSGDSKAPIINPIHKPGPFEPAYKGNSYTLTEEDFKKFAELRKNEPTKLNGALQNSPESSNTNPQGNAPTSDIQQSKTS